MANRVAIVLAAGEGTRMQSELPKVLHAVCGRPMIEFVLNAIRDAGIERSVVVVGYKADEVRDALKGRPGLDFALQEERRGTGHAVMQCEAALQDHFGPVLVVAGDTPLLTGASLRNLLAKLHDEQAACVVGSAVTENNAGLGRIVRDEQGRFERIVEEKDATPEERKIQEINTGCYAFDSRLLFEALQAVQPNNNQGEYYLTDCAAILKARGHRVLADPCLTIEEAMGVNTPDQLAQVAAVLKSRGAC